MAADLCKRTVPQSVVLAILLCGAIPGLAQVDPLTLSALIQEGDLILDEAASLAPGTDKLDEEGRRNGAAGEAVRAEMRSLEDDIKRFNDATEQLNAGAARHAAECPQQSEDAALVERCNAALAELTATSRKLDEQHAALEARRNDGNARAAQYNSANTDFAKRKQENDAREALNLRDGEEWLEHARAFLATDAVQSAVVKAGTVPACSQERIDELGKLPTRQAVTRAQACLKAIKAGAR